MSLENTVLPIQYSEDISKLDDRRKELFKNMRILHPKGNEKVQLKLCIDLNDSRIEYYINNIFKTDNK